MGWIEAYTREDKPEFEDISAYVDCPFWEGLCEFIEETYSIKPAIEYSRCSGAPGTELMLGSFSSYLQELYKNTNVFNGSRWLMIDVATEKIFEEVKELLCIRIHPPKKKAADGTSR